MPNLLEENHLAVTFWADVNLLGPRLAILFSDFEMTGAVRGDMLAKLRVLADESERVKAEKRQKER